MLRISNIDDCLCVLFTIFANEIQIKFYRVSEIGVKLSMTTKCYQCVCVIWVVWCESMARMSSIFIGLKMSIKMKHRESASEVATERESDAARGCEPN